MLRSMYAGVSGLRIHQTRMDVIGNNIANVNTTGFKSGRVTFNEIFSQTLQGASGASENMGGRNPMQVGLGANIASIDTLMTEGAAQRTDNTLDMKIEGDGFFIVKNAGGYKFTRAGAFNLDEVGNLCNPAGLNLMGWQPDADGNIIKEKVSKLQIYDADNIYSKPTTTTKAHYTGNINKDDTDLASTTGLMTTFSVYDSQGYKYNVDFSLKKTATANEYTFEVEDVKDSKGTSLGATPAVSTTIKFLTDGTIDTATSKLVLTLSSITGGSTFSDVEIDLSSLTQFGGESTVKAVGGDKDGLGAGNAAGTLSGYDIGQDGKIFGKYTNNQTKLLGQIAIAKFQNPAGLQKSGNNLFEVTNNSGDFDGIGVDITSSGGKLNSGVLEMSNVDLSSEFTDMITTQRGFQANSRIITASDEMLQELVNLKR